MGPLTPQPYQPPQHGLRAGTALTRGGGGALITLCPHALQPPSTPRQGRGPASAVTAAALRTHTLWTAGAQPGCPWLGPRP